MLYIRLPKLLVISIKTQSSRNLTLLRAKTVKICIAYVISTATEYYYAGGVLLFRELSRPVVEIDPPRFPNVLALLAALDILCFHRLRDYGNALGIVNSHRMPTPYDHCRTRNIILAIRRLIEK